MIVKIGEVVDAVDALKELSEQKMPIATSFKITKFIKDIAPEVENFQTHRMKWFKELGEEDEVSKVITIKPENIDKFNKEMEDLRNVEIRVDFKKLKLEELGENVQLSPRSLIFLEKFLEE